MAEPITTITAVNEKPLIVQGDRTILVEVASPQYARRVMPWWASRSS